MAEEGHAEIHARITRILSPHGLEVHPFKVGWYNDHVQPVFHLDYPQDTLAFVIISTPSMFENAFKPFVQKTDCCGPQDLLDQCMAHYFHKIKEEFPKHHVETIHDFEMHPSRRPKVLVQSAGHVAGAAYYYQRKDVQNDPWGNKKIYGVSVHPKYGGWFALRGVVIFTDIQAPDLPRQDAPDAVKGDKNKIELLERFNTNWQDWTYRDIIPVEAKYSEEQKKYFATMPADRTKIIEQIKNS